MSFSFEILPPLKGRGIESVWRVIDRLRPYEPSCVNITSHHSETVYQPAADGLLRATQVLRRPGTVAIAAAIQYRYGIPAVPHIICKGFTKEETEYALIDLSFLGIRKLFLLRGDAKNLHISPEDAGQYHEHATDLQAQVNEFNASRGGDEPCFTYGMACYPEKHEEAPNMESDLRWAKAKVDAGAEYLVTQMFFDNERYFSFVERARQAGITVPIVPGLKPIVLLNQLTVLPRVFHVDLPEALSHALYAARTDEEAKAVGTEWCIEQSRELLRRGVPSLHFYTYLASDSVEQVVKAVL